jgi:hypothetical protein
MKIISFLVIVRYDLEWYNESDESSPALYTAGLYFS